MTDPLGLPLWVFVLLVIFPKFQDLFESIRDQLPGTTLALMFASEFLRNHWLLSPVALGLAIAGLLAWVRSPAGARACSPLKA